MVSVVLCTYNGAAFINDQLMSICNQTYKDLEIIIVDDASSDATFEIAKQYADRDDRIQLHRNERNLGFKDNFNKAVQLTSGAFIAFSDQDDIWHEDKISDLMQNWSQQSQLIYCDSQRFSEKIPWDSSPKKNYRRFEGTDVRKLSVYNTISGHAMMIKKEILPMIFPVDENIFYDWKAGVVAACNGGVTYLPKTLVFQRVHDNNISMGAGFHTKDEKSKLKFKKMIAAHTRDFSKIDSMQKSDSLFMNNLSQLFTNSFIQSFSLDLFIFLLKNRKIIFSYKKKAFPFFSHIKHSYRLAKS